MNKFVVLLVVLLGLQFSASLAMAKNHNKKGNHRQCDSYAIRKADRDNSKSSNRTLKGAAYGAASGALVGAVVDGGSGAWKGAAGGGGVGAIVGSIRNDRKWRDNYDKYYRDCMRGRR
ncbi:YMGG-like glycine zipper-containing protein [Desulfosediminicola sp.]|uniref:YMGG-like glycine zipper-containing protein n=1 Tax=Desulfosediminicola sp. TaxID=2886825 RepID=UPI003AF2C0E8